MGASGDACSTWTELAKTVTVTDEVRPPKVAVMVAVPGPTPVTRPLALTVAIDGADETN